MAEGAGFEPARSCPQHAFQACALNRSAIPPEHTENRRPARRLPPVARPGTFRHGAAPAARGRPEREAVGLWDRCHSARPHIRQPRGPALLLPGPGRLPPDRPGLDLVRGPRQQPRRLPGIDRAARLARCLAPDLLGARPAGLARAGPAGPCCSLPAAVEGAGDEVSTERPYGRILHPIFNAARNASCGISTWPTWRMRFLPSFCFSRSLRLRVMSPP